jgi:ribosome-binding factor A
MQVALAELVARRAKDPGLQEAMFSFVSVDVAPDMAHARVHVSVMGNSEQKTKVIDALKRSAPFLHRELSRQLHMRRVPSLIFQLDESIEEAERITSLMREIARSEGRDF